MMPITLQYANSGQKHSSLDTTHTATQDRKTENLAPLETHEINNLIKIFWQCTRFEIWQI